MINRSILLPSPFVNIKGQMAELKEAVQKLIKAGIVVEQDAFEILKKNSDPLKLAEAFLSINPSKENVNRKDLINILKKPIIRKKPTSLPSSKISKIPRRHRRKKIETVGERIKKEITVERNTNGGTMLLHKTVIRTQFEDLQGLHDYDSEFKVIKDSIVSTDYKGTVDDIIGYFQNRFQKLSSLFRNRVDIPNLTDIRILNLRRDEGEISVIGMITDKQFPPSGGGLLFIEDPHSEQVLHVIIPKSNAILVEKSIQLMNDTVVCVTGYIKKGNLIANDIILPDIPNLRKSNKAMVPVHVAFLSDIHVGSKNFLEKPLDRFVKFLNGEFGNKKLKALGKQTKYVLFGGDVVDGVGIYVNHLEDLEVDDIKEQYNIFASYLERIPEDVEIVIIPGNHDMVRSAEPQPRILAEHAPALERIPNVHMLANPTQISIHSVETLLYHCTSLPDIMNSIPGVPSDQPVEVMKHMLKARHLAPIWGSKTPIAAEPEDHLVIDRVPDIFHGGHIHINGEGYYKGVQIINSGTMQNQTVFQKSLNIIPTPGQITITNLKTMALNRINFLS